MEKKLTTKVQKINPNLPDNTNNISNALVIEPDDELMLEKKGTIYAVFDVAGKKTLDNLLVTKVVNDILHDSYFQSESASPIQAVEKAILKLRDNVVTLATEEADTEPMISFNISTVILWGNTVYAVQYGNAKTFLMRNGQVKPISSATEGKFSVASGVIKDNDVVILATDDFSKKYPPEQLLGDSGLQIEELELLQSALMLKFNVVKAFSKSEIVDFGEKPLEQPKEEKTQTIAPAEEKKVKKKKTPKAPKKPKDIKINKQRWILSIVVIFAVLGIAAFASGVYKADEKIEDIKTESNVTDAQSSDNEKIEEETTDPGEKTIDPEQDRINRVQRVSPTFFYDISLVDEDAIPTGIVLVGDTLFVGDKSSGSLYLSDVTTPKFVKSNSEYNDIDNLVKYADNLAFTDTEGFKVLTPSSNTIVERHTQSDFGEVSTYLEFIYSLNGNTITKYEKTEGLLEGTPWTTDENLIGANDMAIDVSIYVLKADGGLLKYTAGVQDDFTVEGMDEPFENPVQILSNTDLENMYIVDRGNKRIVILSDQGVLNKQLKLSEPTIWDDLKGVAVNEDETVLYVLDGSKVFEVGVE